MLKSGETLARFEGELGIPVPALTGKVPLNKSFHCSVMLELAAKLLVMEYLTCSL